METDNLNSIQDLIAEKEGGKVEFKQTTGQLERGMETLCAFLNGEGGTVLFGVSDNGKIIGQEVSDKTKREIAEAIGRLEPTATVQVSYVPLPDGERESSPSMLKTQGWNARSLIRVALICVWKAPLSPCHNKNTMSCCSTATVCVTAGNCLTTLI